MVKYLIWLKLVQWLKHTSLRMQETADRTGGCPYSSANPEGGTGGPDPPGKSQVIWVSIGNKQLDPPGKSLTPLENVGPPLEP